MKLIKRCLARTTCTLPPKGNFPYNICGQYHYKEAPPHKCTEDDFLTALGIRDTNPEAIRYIQEFKWWRERRKELNLPAIVNPLLESYYRIYSSDKEAEITCRLHEEESSDRENIERPQAAEARAKTPTEVEED